MGYQHPGQAFLSQFGALRSGAEIAAYGEFLRSAAGLSSDPPIDLEKIYARFEMPLPRPAPLTDQQGILLDGDRGLVLIKADDPRVRQRFTEGHELMELLFEAQVQSGAAWQVTGDPKEKWCDRGAASLLMPRESFAPRLKNLGCSIATAKKLAAAYQTSLLATLMRMMQVAEGVHCLRVWRLGWADMAATTGREPPQLWSWWQTATAGWTASPLGCVWHQPSPLPAQSVIGLAHALDQFLTGTEDWGSMTSQGGDRPQRCAIEALPLTLGHRRAVVSLFHQLETGE